MDGWWMDGWIDGGWLKGQATESVLGSRDTCCPNILVGRTQDNEIHDC